MAQCPTCGSRVADGAEVCPDCGMDLQGASTSGPQQTPSASVAPASDSPVPPAHPEHSSFSPSPAPPPGILTHGAARVTLKRSGVLSNETFPIGDRVMIGRFDPETGPVDVDLGPLPEAAYVSRQHAEIWRDGSGQWFVKDLGSRNGTYIRPQGQPQFQRATGDQPISDGDEVALGQAQFEFRLA